MVKVPLFIRVFSRIMMGASEEDNTHVQAVVNLSLDVATPEQMGAGPHHLGVVARCPGEAEQTRRQSPLSHAQIRLFAVTQFQDQADTGQSWSAQFGIKHPFLPDICKNRLLVITSFPQTSLGQSLF